MSQSGRLRRNCIETRSYSSLVITVHPDFQYSRYCRNFAMALVNCHRNLAFGLSVPGIDNSPSHRARRSKSLCLPSPCGQTTFDRALSCTAVHFQISLRRLPSFHLLSSWPSIIFFPLPISFYCCLTSQVVCALLLHVSPPPEEESIVETQRDTQGTRDKHGKARGCPSAAACLSSF